jgi:signal transduction histidine kinase
MTDIGSDRRLLTVGWIAAALVALGWGARLLRPLGAPLDLLVILTATALLCGAALAVRRGPTVAWIGFIGAATLAATQSGPFAIEARLSSPDPAVWLTPALLVSLSVVLAALCSWLYASRSVVPRPGRMVAGALFVWTIGSFAVSLAPALIEFPADPELTLRDFLVAPVRVPRIVIAVIAAIGLLADLDPAIRRARSRLRRDRGGLRSSIVIVADEVSGRAATGRSAAAAERRRLAGELHADIVPAVRAALRDVEAGAPAERLASSLRSVADELDRLVDDRSSLVLEQVGLVAALEALAERVEARDGVSVVLEIADQAPPPDRVSVGRSAGDGRAPVEVEAAAYLVARLAIDNAIRHGRATTIDVSVTESPEAMLLVVRDDGRSIAIGSPDAAVAQGGRGLADMERAADGIAASLRVGPSDPAGTSVRLAWPAGG